MYFVLILLLEKVHKVQVQILSSELCCMPHSAIRALCRNVTHYAGTANVTMCTGFCANNL